MSRRRRRRRHGALSTCRGARARRPPGRRARAWERAPGRAGCRAASARPHEEGSPKARVLPEPVFALPHTSRPAMPSGMVSAWTGNGAVMPCECRPPPARGHAQLFEGRGGTGSGASSSGSELSSSAGPWRSCHRLCRSLVFADGRPSAAGGPASMTSAPAAHVADHRRTGGKTPVRAARRRGIRSPVVAVRVPNRMFPVERLVRRSPSRPVQASAGAR